MSGDAFAYFCIGICILGFILVTYQEFFSKKAENSTKNSQNNLAENSANLSAEKVENSAQNAENCVNLNENSFENSAKNSLNLSQNSTKNSHPKDKDKIYFVVFSALFVSVIFTEIFIVVIELYGYDEAILISEVSIKDLVMFVLIFAPFMAYCLGASVLLSKINDKILPFTKAYKIATFIALILAILLIYATNKDQVMTGSEFMLNLAIWTFIVAGYTSYQRKQAKLKKCR